MVLSMVYVSGNGRMVCYSLASPVLWMLASLLSLYVSMESCVRAGYVFKCVYILSLTGNYVVFGT